MNVELTDEEALALAQMCKRAFFERVRPFAENDAEARLMLSALRSVRDALDYSGFSPR